MLFPINWIKIFQQFMAKLASESCYEIIDIYQCQHTGLTRAQIKLSGRHIIEKNICDIITDMQFLEGFDKKTIRTLTYMATVENMKPDYSIISQQLDIEADNFILKICNKNGKEFAKLSPIEMSKNKSLLSKFSPIDANQIGYLAGIKETAKEFSVKAKIHENTRS